MKIRIKIVIFKFRSYTKASKSAQMELLSRKWQSKNAKGLHFCLQVPIMALFTNITLIN